MNRWCDKPVQLVVFDNARAGIMGEHSVMDGTPTCRMCDDVLEMLADPAFDHGSPPPTSAAATPDPMDWTITPALATAIASASKEAVALIRSQTLGYHLTRYGKKAIKAFGVSPDGWAQMIIQLAYARLLVATTTTGAPAFAPSIRRGATYEAATTRKFYKGRTEAIRVISSESDRWVRAMDDPRAGREEKKRAFADAVKRHGADARRCGAGLGVDRHLLGGFIFALRTSLSRSRDFFPGMKKSLKEGEELPALYTDPLVQRSSYWVLSTSSVFSKNFVVYGWGEVVPDGFGVAYMTGFDGLSLPQLRLSPSCFPGDAKLPSLHPL
jgi:carnitine O-acetyltransferase